MGSQHADPALTVRPPKEIQSAAKAVLDARGREMRAFVTACLAAVAAEPDEVLAMLASHWPAPKPRGRPRGAGRRE
ncbi:hypothetical protein [Salinispora arenicola]|uniref:hypothetical protein n=1 Tax=Salinispora arenicola TaxID=168697 RepID=UPI0003674F1D|nr:hypothetical protein [Salinispora arenicola]